MTKIAFTVRTLAEVNRYQVQKLLRWNDLQYGQYQYETGLEYLERMLDGDNYGIRQMSGNALFWKWWRNHWSVRDAAFLSSTEGVAVTELEGQYRSQHSLDHFRYFPPKVITKACFIRDKKSEEVKQ